MLFEKKDMRLVSVRNIERDGGKTITFVKIADKKTFEGNDFILGRETAVKSLIAGNDYDVELTVDGKYNSVNLWEPLPEKKKTAV